MGKDQVISDRLQDSLSKLLLTTSPTKKGELDMRLFFSLTPSINFIDHIIQHVCISLSGMVANHLLYVV